jgi:hypothetical protein
MPDFRSEIGARLAGLGLSPAREMEIADELTQHLEDEYEQALSRGVSEDEAERAVLADLKVPNLLGRELNGWSEPFHRTRYPWAHEQGAT